MSLTKKLPITLAIWTCYPLTVPLLCDKGFLIEDECVARRITPYIPLVNGECHKWEVLMCQRQMGLPR